MAESQLVGQTRQRTHNSLTGARSGLSTLSNRVNQIQADTRWSDEGRSQQIAFALADGSVAFRGLLEDSQSNLRVEIQGADRRLSGLRQVPPEALNDRRQALGPFLQRAFDDPEVVLNLYRVYFEDPPSRRVLEDHVGNLITALGNDGAALAEQWRALVEELAPQRPPEEQQALADRSALYELKGYLDAGEALMNIDLATLDEDGGLSAEAMLGRPFLEAAINGYESAHGLESSQPQAS